MRVPLNTLEKLTGVFLLSVVTLFGLWFFWNGREGLSELFRGGAVYYVVAGTGMGTNVGSPVKMFDVVIGTVTAVTIIDERAHPGKRIRLTLKVDESAARNVTSGTTAVLGAGAMPLGAAAVDLRPAGEGLLKPGSTLVAIEEQTLLAGLTKDAEELKASFRRILAEVEAILKGVHEMADKVNAGKGVAGRVFNDEQVMDDVHAAIKDVRRVAGGADALMGNLNRAAEGGPRLMGNAVAASGEANKALQRLNVALEALPALVADLVRTIGQVRELLATVRSAAAYAPEVARKADSSLEEMQRLIEALQKNFLVRGTMSAKPAPRTESISRPRFDPPAPPGPSSGAPAEAPSR
jgi:ABC-type transporter Mla subunit MlaD